MSLQNMDFAARCFEAAYGMRSRMLYRGRDFVGREYSYNLIDALVEPMEFYGPMNRLLHPILRSEDLQQV